MLLTIIPAVVIITATIGSPVIMAIVTVTIVVTRLL